MLSLICGYKGHVILVGFAGIVKCTLSLGFRCSNIYVSLICGYKEMVCLVWIAWIGKCTLNLGYGYMEMYACYI